MKGTARSATLATRFSPPMMTKKPMATSTSPMMSATSVTCESPLPHSTGAWTFAKKADSTFLTILLTWPMLPMPKEARMAEKAKKMLRTLPSVLQPL